VECAGAVNSRPCRAASRMDALRHTRMQEVLDGGVGALLGKLAPLPMSA